MGNEREYKFAVPPDWEMPSLDGVAVVEPGGDVEQTATYYDTSDLRLSRAGASLRYRDDDGWTVKLPVSDHARRVLVRREQVYGGGPGLPPVDALELVAARSRTARLSPVARLHTCRRTLLLRGPAGDDTSGRALGTLVDDRCTVVEGRTSGTFRELELELAPDADDDALEAIAGRLRDAGASEADPVPKVTRALGPAASAPPDVVSSPVASPPSVEAVVRHAISDAVLRLVTSDPVVRIGEDVEGVHQARVATRRLRSHLRTFRSLLDPDWSQSLRDELGWLADELGAVRDADVLRERLESRVAALDDADREAAAPVLARVTAQQAAARDVLLEGLRSTRYLALLDRLVDAAARPRVVARVGGDDEEALRALVRAPWRQLKRAVAHLPDPAPDPALHAVRIRAKRARYAAEVMEPAFGADARDFAKAITKVQDLLGEHQDAVVAGQWLRTTALGLPDPAAVYAAGELGAAERAAAEASRADWPRVWKAASKRSLRRWL